MLDYTGHPIFDVGLAAIVAFVNKDRPEELTASDLEAVSDYMAQNYVRNPLKSFLTVAFPNSGFTQPAYEKTPENREIYSQRVLCSFHSDTPKLEERDVFLGIPATDITFDVKGELAPGRVFRQHIPLQTGEGVINFHPYGDAGLAVSGLSLLAIQAYPLGSAKCQGRTLSVHSDNPEIMRFFAAQFLQQNMAAIQLAQQANSNKMPEPHLKFRTLLIETLLQVGQQQIKSRQRAEPFSITAYHMTNSGQGADLDIYHLPAHFIGYLQLMLSADYALAWEQLVRSAWILPKLKRGETQAPTDFQPDRNFLYEDFMRLAEDVYRQAPRFIRTYFLRYVRRYAQSDGTDPRQQYATHQEVNLISWKLTEPFLRRILNMDNERIAHIRALGDALAEYIRIENDTRFFQNFFRLNRYGYLRNELIKVNTAHVRRGNAPFLTLDSYLGVFEDGENLPNVQWGLARDLVFIRMVEQLYANGWLKANRDAVPEERDEPTES